MIKKINYSYIVITVIALLLINGCGSFKISPQQDATFNMTLRMAAKHLTYEIIRKNPADIDTLSAIIDTALPLINEDNSINLNTILDPLSKYFIDKCEDEILKSDLKDLLEMMKITIVGTTIEIPQNNKDLKIVIEKLRIALEGMQSGLNLSKDIKL